MPPSESAKEILELLSRDKQESGSGKPNPISDQLAEILLTQKTNLTKEEILGRLKRAHECLQVKHKFHLGQIVKWKEGLQNKKIPRYGDPAIVIELLKSPVVDSGENAGSPYFREELNIILGVLDPGGDFVIFHYDSRRFEPFA
jgi:hypothetical protein